MWICCIRRTRGAYCRVWKNADRAWVTWSDAVPNACAVAKTSRRPFGVFSAAGGATERRRADTSLPDLRCHYLPPVPPGGRHTGGLPPPVAFTACARRYSRLPCPHLPAPFPPPPPAHAHLPRYTTHPHPLRCGMMNERTRTHPRLPAYSRLAESARTACTRMACGPTRLPYLVMGGIVE